MHIIQNNPYRTVGLLVGATAAEQRRQLTRLQRFLEADQEPEEDFSFPILGNIHRTIETVNEASSKLNLDSDKMYAALFWFYIGNPITDEPAFDALKEANLDQVLNIWTKIISNGEVSQRNASAYCNLGTLYLSGILTGKNTYETLLEQGISLKLKFLESDCIKEFKSLTTDETYKATKKELQLLFLSEVQAEIEKNGGMSLDRFLDILAKQKYLAKEDFLKGFVQKPIEQIEKYIEGSKTKRKADKSSAWKIGVTLRRQTREDLKRLKSILGETNIKYSSLADKVANEILQCSIEYFNYHQANESDVEYYEQAYKLAIMTKAIAIGKLTKDRIIDSLNTLDEMKDNEMSQAIQVLESVKNAYEVNRMDINRKAMEMTLGPNQIINWGKVHEMVENSINWDKVIELVQKVIPQTNIEKIKRTNDSAKINEYRLLVDFLTSKLKYLQIRKIKYLCYWLKDDTVANIVFTVKIMPVWTYVLAGIVVFLLLIAGIWGADGLKLVLQIAAVIGVLALIGWFQNMGNEK